MLKFLIKIIVAAITLSLGIIVCLFWNLSFIALPKIEVQEHTAEIEQLNLIKISNCQVLNIPESYNDRMVSIDATAFVADDAVRLFPNKTCYEIVNDLKLIIPVLELEDFSGANHNLKNLLESSNSPPTKEVDIRVVGIVKKYYEENGSLQYLIIPNSIELISPIREYEIKATA